MALVLSTPSIVSAATTPPGPDEIATRLCEMLQQHIHHYISEQRTRGPLRLAEEEQTRPQPAQPPPPPPLPQPQRQQHQQQHQQQQPQAAIRRSDSAYVAQAHRVLARQLSIRHDQRSTPDGDRWLHDIFDTPECRTEQVSSATSWVCQLRRRDHKFFRVEPETVEATERRMREWAESAMRLPAGEGETSSAMHLGCADVRWLLDDVRLGPTTTIFHVDNVPGSATAFVPSPTPTPAHMLCQSWLGCPELAMRSYALSAALDLLPGPPSLYSPSSSGPVHEAAAASSRRSSSLFSTPSSSLIALVDDPPQPVPPRAATPDPSIPRIVEVTDDRDDLPGPAVHRPPTASRSTLPTTPRSDPVVHEAPRRHRRTHSKPWSWLPAPRTMAPVKRMKSVSKKGRRQSHRKTLLTSARAREFGDSMVDLLSGRAFHRVEVDEMIDTTLIGAMDLTSSPRPGPADPADASRRSSERASADGASARPGRPSGDGVGRDAGRSLAPLSHIRQGSPFADAVDDALLTLPAAGSTTAPVTPSVLPTAGREPRPRAHSLAPPAPGRRTRLGSPDATAAERTGSRSHSRSTSIDDVDWTAFQMAISGPTGDFLMSGDAPSDDGVGDDVVDWFLDYGFVSEGLMVQSDADTSDDDDGDDDDAFLDHEMPDDALMPKPLASGPALAGDDDGATWKMSCNLSDLGDYLTYETYHVGFV
ncbi:MAG: hypothetical protein M1826_006316 [Phylliscum demangeonii]|nr:MAG: hypothetical protein M1826_006316 [Phylliscum demangeonii]